MRLIELPWETWRAIIAVLREKDLPSKQAHADRLEQLDADPPDHPSVTLTLTGDLFPCSPTGRAGRWGSRCRGEGGEELVAIP